MCLPGDPVQDYLVAFGASSFSITQDTRVVFYYKRELPLQPSLLLDFK